MEEIKELGLKGEMDICRRLRDSGYYVKKPDGLIKIGNDFFLIETKNKEPYNPPPFWGQGLDYSQYQNYMEIYSLKKLRTIFFVKNKENEWVWNYLDRLNQGQKHITKNQIILFPLSSFFSIDLLRKNQESIRFLHELLNRAYPTSKAKEGF